MRKKFQANVWNLSLTSRFSAFISMLWRGPHGFTCSSNDEAFPPTSLLFTASKVDDLHMSTHMSVMVSFQVTKCLSLSIIS